MIIRVEPKSFAAALAKLKPNRSRLRSVVESGPIQISATGNIVMLTGTLDSSAMVTATVIEPGGGFLSLDSVIRLLKTYRKGSEVELKYEPGYFWVGPTRLQVASR